MVFRDVSMEREYGRRIRLLSDHDSLTGLYNRRFAEEALHGFNTRDNLPLAVIMCDVNGLKLTNDVFGLETGDALLRQVAELLTRSCRKGDLAARWGSDEFVILMPRTGLQDAEKLIERMKNADLSLDEGGLPMSLSLGCAIKTTIDQSILAVVAEAEENMHHQKLLDGKSYRNAVINTLLATLY
jgi:diguanylate cyclase (GGDEF)-like protein